MKRTCAVLLPAFVLAVAIIPDSHAQTQPVGQQNVPPPTAYSIVENEANSRVWQRVTYETGPNGEQRQHIHKYTELATGLNHLVNGQWVESKEEIDVLPDGSAAATNGQHQVYFPADIYQGQIGLVMPDGLQLHSRPMGMSYDDGTNTVLIAALTNSVGQLLSSNQVIYPNAFAGFNADLLYTYTKAGLEQDVVLREQPPPPEQCGLSSQSARLQLLTEFFNPPEPVQTTRVVSSRSGLSDTTLNFGTTVMVRGKAFLMGDQRTNRSVRVCKSWQHVDGRTFLVEEVPVAKLERSLETLPPAVPITSRSASPLPYKISRVRQLTPQRLAQAGTNRIQLATAEVKHGLVLDYVTFNNVYGTNFTFQGDTTYYINGGFDIFGDTTFEGGTVIKYYTDEASYYYSILYPLGDLIFKTSAYRPAVFTSYDDDSVGEVISGSDGNPGDSGYDSSTELAVGNSNVISNCRFCYANIGLDGDSEIIEVQDCQFLDCGVACMGEGDNDFVVRNVLVANYTDGFLGDGTAFSSNDGSDYLAVQAENLTSVGGTFIQGDTSVSGVVCLTNCIIAEDMEYWNSVFTNCTVINPSGTLFESVGGGNYYLTNGSPYRNAGTTNISPALLADLAAKTTYPPIVYSNVTISVVTNMGPQALRDSGSPGPDLGYHYDPLDYVFGGCEAQSNITFTAGTAVGWFRTGSGWYHAGYGIFVANQQSVTFQGTATSPCYWVRLNNVQEEDQSAGYGPGGLDGEDNQDDHDISLSPVVNLYFTCSAEMTGDPGELFRDDWGYLIVQAHDSEFHGNFGGYGMSASLTNCLLERSGPGVSQGWTGDFFNVVNCTFHGGTIALIPGSAPVSIHVLNCAFDGATVSASGYGSNTNYAQYDYNAFTNVADKFPVGGAHDVIVTNGFNWQDGPLGNYYEPTGSPLINAGSESADAVGLADYTVLTNQTPDTGTVDMGYHYPAAGNDSTGTDFWLTFFDFDSGGNMSLYISSPVATIGAVTYLANDPVLTITGDPAVNGTYMLTNVPEAEMESVYDIDPLMYVNSTNEALQVASIDGQTSWGILSYDSGSESVSEVFYIKSVFYPLSPDGTNWLNPDSSPAPAVIVSCPQVLFSQPFSLAAGAMTNVAIPLDDMLISNDVVEGKGIHVTASQPVSVYGFDYLNTDSTAFTAYPTTMLGTSYCVMARASPKVCDCDTSPYHSQLAIVGTVTNTTVTITPSVTANLYNHTDAYSINLNQGETYQINSSDDSSDVTGTLITSTAPIAVFAGDSGAQVPDGNAFADNPLMQEQAPVDQWGTNILAISFAGRTNGDTYRILSAQSNTVSITGTVVTGYPGTLTTNYETVTTNLAAGAFCDIILDGPIEFQASQPIQVAQFANGFQFDNPAFFYGDPCEVLVPPTGHYLSSYTVYTSTNDDVTGDFAENYLNLIVAQSATNSTLLDGSPIAATNFVAIGSSGYYGAQLSVTNSGAHTVNSSQPIEVQVYGFGYKDAYGYFGGMTK